MNEFTTGRSLRTSSLPLRVTLTGFGLFLLIGAVTNIGLLAWKTGFTPTGFAHYYRGFEPPADSAQDFVYPKEFHELLENTHFHVYIIPLVLLVMTHVLFMTAWSDRAKVSLTVFGYGAALADLAAPWLVRYVSAGFGWWKLVSSTAFHGVILLLLCLAFYEAWLRPVLPAEVEDTG